MLSEGVLQRGELAVGAEALDRLNRGAVGLDRQHHAALQKRPVDDHRAGAAVAGIAADVRAGEVKVVAEKVDEQAPGLDLSLVGRAVHLDADRRLCDRVAHWATSSAVRWTGR